MSPVPKVVEGKRAAPRRRRGRPSVLRVASQIIAVCVRACAGVRWPDALVPWRGVCGCRFSVAVWGRAAVRAARGIFADNFVWRRGGMCVLRGRVWARVRGWRTGGWRRRQVGVARTGRGGWEAMGRWCRVCTPVIAARLALGARAAGRLGRAGWAAVWRRCRRFGHCAGTLGGVVGAAFGRGRRFSAGVARLFGAVGALWRRFAARRWGCAGAASGPAGSPILGGRNGAGGVGAGAGRRRPRCRTCERSKRARRRAAARRVAAALLAVRARSRHWRCAGAPRLFPAALRPRAHTPE